MPPKKITALPTHKAIKPPRPLGCGPRSSRGSTQDLSNVDSSLTSESESRNQPLEPRSNKRQRVNFSDGSGDEGDTNLILNDFIDDDDEDMGAVNLDDKSDPSLSQELSDLSDADFAQNPTDQTPDASQDSESTISQGLLARLLYEHFENKDTQIETEAMAVICKYVEMFAREAIARAVLEKREEIGDDGRGGGGIFLEVEDLEKLAPQLLLDF